MRACYLSGSLKACIFAGTHPQATPQQPQSAVNCQAGTMAAKTAPSLKWSLLVLSALAAFNGVGFIAWACIIQNPPVSAVPL